MTNPSSPAVSYDALVREIAELLEVSPEELSPQDSLLDWGLDSIRIMTLVERWRALGVDVNFLTLAEAPTLAEYARLLGASDAPES